MADFRKIVVALAVLVIAAGMANAQTFACSASVAAPPQLRSEGLTEMIGDIVLDCTGNGPAGLANFTVYSPATITSRINSSRLSESLLLIDEPGDGAASLGLVAPAGNGVGPGCTSFGAAGTPPQTAATTCTYNTFAGVVSAPPATSSVTFLGIPVVPPGSAHRIYRITNIRVNANGFAGGTTGAVPLVVQLSISGTTAVPVNQTNFTAGFVTKSMVFDGLVGESSGYSLRQCEGANVEDTIRFRELFASAFKPRRALDATGAPIPQVVPGFSYNSESGLSPTGSVTGLVSAVADWGTRLRVVFNNIPLGTSISVSRYNVETDENSAPAQSAVFHTGTQTATLAQATTSTVTVVASDATTGTAIWEVIGGSATALENYDFNIFITATPNPQASPAAGVQGTMTGNYAPTPTTGTNSLAAWSVARSTYIPRFVDPGTTYNLIIFNLCRTNLLFPYVLGGVAGFDTGIAITNTSTDPWKTTPQSGKCLLNFYGANAPAVFTTPSIGAKTTDSGVIWASSAMGLAAGFNGYIIAQCDFQYAHGFAFVSDIGAHNIAMGYLALILPDVDGIGSRPVGRIAAIGAENLNN